MFDLNIPPRRDPVARIVLFALFDCAVYLTDDPSYTLWILVPIILLQMRSLHRLWTAVPVYQAAQRVKIGNALRFAILKRDGYRCQICGANAANGTALEVDHRHPVARGGTNDPANLWTLCATCNNGKSDSSL